MEKGKKNIFGDYGPDFVSLCQNLCGLIRVQQSCDTVCTYYIHTIARDFVLHHSYHVNMEDNNYYIPERNEIWPIVTRCIFLSFPPPRTCIYTQEKYGWLVLDMNVLSLLVLLTMCPDWYDYI